jgi:mannose-6-phosphate isomerase-like protein (cupin superfamily)
VILAGAADDSSILTSAPSLSVSAFTPSVEGPTVFSERANYVCTLLTSCRANARRDIYLISAEPGTPRRSDPHMPGVIEHVVLCAGRALVGVTEDPVELHPGDYITYPGDVAHVLKASIPAPSPSWSPSTADSGNGLPAALGKAVGFGHVVDIDADHGFT